MPAGQGDPGITILSYNLQYNIYESITHFKSTIHLLSFSQIGSCNRMNEGRLTQTHLVNHKMLHKMFGTV